MTDRAKVPRTKARFVRFVPPAVTVLLAVFCVLAFRDIKAGQLLQLLPKTPLAAAGALLFAYALKSMSMVFPVTVLFLAAGAVFHPLAALLLNLLGLTVSVTLQYWIGRYSGEGLFCRLSEKHPRLRRAVQAANHNEFFASYLLRAAGVLNLDLTSMALGAAGISYRPFLFGSLLGLLPGMVLQTLMGRHLDEPFSPAFLLLFGAMLLLSFASALLCRLWERRKAAAE